MHLSLLSFPSFRKLRHQLALLAIVVFGVTGCAPIASVDSTTPVLPAAFPAQSDLVELEQARLEALSAQQLVDSAPQESMSDSFSAAQHSLHAMKTLSGDQEKQAILVYNFSIARMIDALKRAKLKPWKDTITLKGPDGPVYLNATSDSLGTWNPKSDKIEVTDRMIIGGRYFTDRVRLEGVGATLVCTGPGRMEPLWAPMRHFVSATAVMTFSGNHGTLRVVNPSATEKIVMAGKTRPVAADLSAPIAVNIVTTHPELMGLLALLNASKYEKGARLIMMEPYRPDARPVIFIHGLMDSPLSWVPEINAFNGNPELRKRYQVWYFQYSSAPPFPLSAEILRQQLAVIYQKYPKTPKAVLVGHSMGGLISRMLICDSGTQYCRGILGKSVAELNLGTSPDALMVAGALQFKASPYVSRVIFEATPHRGAAMASDPIGRIGAMLIRLPVKMVAMGPELLKQSSVKKSDRVLDRFPNSIDTLRPQALVIKAMDKLPLNPKVPYHSIIGDAGESGPIATSTDDIVPYSSSHLEGAKSEKMVPYWHSEVLMGLETIAEVQRILLEN